MDLDNILFGLIAFLTGLIAFLTDKPRSWREKKAGPIGLSDAQYKSGYWLILISGIGLILYGLFA
ncbi:MAG: hypothetical protein ABJG99_17775 [Crocinitomicaceae bacterium]